MNFTLQRDTSKTFISSFNKRHGDTSPLQEFEKGMMGYRWDCSFSVVTLGCVFKFRYVF